MNTPFVNRALRWTCGLVITVPLAVFAADDTVAGLSSLEISTRYLEVTRAGALQAEGRIVRMSHKTAFLDGRLTDLEGRLLATTQSVAKIQRKQAKAG